MDDTTLVVLMKQQMVSLSKDHEVNKHFAAF